MIELITGLPGNSKTLFSIRHLIDRASQENRAVYYSGLKEFKADDPRLKGTTWTEFDPLKWHETVPSGALIFIDEAQTIFRARSARIRRSMSRSWSSIDIKVWILFL